MEKVNILQFGAVQESAPYKASINNMEFEVYKTVPYERILDMVQWGINIVIGEKTFVSAPLYELVTDLLIAQNYSNIDITILEKGTTEPSELYELYDLLHGHGIMQIILENSDEQQVAFFKKLLHDTLTSIVAYRNSAAGLLDIMASNADNNSASIQNALDILNDTDKLQEVHKYLDAMGADQLK